MRAMMTTQSNFPPLGTLALLILKLMGPAPALAQGNTCDAAIALAYAQNDAVRAEVAPRILLEARKAQTALRAMRREVALREISGLRREVALREISDLRERRAGLETGLRVREQEEEIRLIDRRIPSTDSRNRPELIAERNQLRRDLAGSRREWSEFATRAGLDEHMSSSSISEEILRTDQGIVGRRLTLAQSLPGSFQSPSPADDDTIISGHPFIDGRYELDLDRFRVSRCRYDLHPGGIQSIGVRAAVPFHGWRLCSTMELAAENPRIIHDLQWLRIDETGMPAVVSLIDEQLSPECRQRLAALRPGPSPVVGTTPISRDDQGRLISVGRERSDEPENTEARAAH